MFGDDDVDTFLMPILVQFLEFKMAVSIMMAVETFCVPDEIEPICTLQ